MTSYTERYIAAAIRTLPPTAQGDVRDELQASIADAIDARVDAGQPFVDAERAVLTELGDPDVLAARYADRPLQLIGPRYYLVWWRLLKLLLWIVIPCAMVGHAIALVLTRRAAGLDASANLIGEVIGGSIALGLSVGVHVAFWTTLVFAILERTGTDTGVRWSVDQLPEPGGDGTGRSDLIASLVLLGALAGAILWDSAVGFARTPERWMPVLDQRLWPWGIAWLFATLVLSALVAIAVYAKGRWTSALAALNAVAALAFAVPALVLLVQDGLLSPAFTATFLPGAALPVTKAVLGVVIIAVAGWSIVDGFAKARRATR
ncbi:permease prefix domain 1-containing protein [Microbacterium sp. KNMS]